MSYADLVDGTEEFIAHRRSAQRKGATAAKGDKATLRFAVYADATFDRLVEGAKQGQLTCRPSGAVAQ